MKNLYGILMALAISAPAWAAGPVAAETPGNETRAEDKLDLVDCRDYRGLLQRVGDQCLRPSSVRTVYSRKQLEMAGALGAGSALKRLDPRF